MDRSKDYYADLGLTPRATEDGIQKAYRRLAKRYHPDHAGDQGVEKFRAVQEAYQVLSDPQQRQQYDRQIAPKPRLSPAAPEPLIPSRSSRIRPEPFGAPAPAVFSRRSVQRRNTYRDDGREWAALAADMLVSSYPPWVWFEAEDGLVPPLFQDLLGDEEW